ncbi:MAG TPA: GNAT family N-acetyltransferase [Dehalococcoidales bacterium]|nr:GNAT family N-acetyltransferase [Dehalococcoidales bacterium]
MSNSPYTISNYQPTDFDKYVRLSIEAEKLEPTGRCVSPQVIAEHLGRPNCSPEQDLFIVEIDRDIVGYMDVAPELTIGRVILDCWIHPEHRRRGLATKLLSYATRRAQELGASLAHISIPQDNIVAKSVLSKLGFECVRRFLELRLDMAKVSQQDIDRPALGWRHLQPGEEAKLTQIQNRALTGTWGYNPNTVEEIMYRTSSSTCSPEDIILTCEGDKVIGYCWTEITGGGGTAIGRKGRIFMLGADPDYRGRGVGKKALLAGLAHLKGKGLRVAELTVDSENKAACALYQSIGFEVRASTLWYEKAIN